MADPNTNTYTYGDEISNTNMPELQDAGMQQYIDQLGALLGGSDYVTQLISGAMNVTPPQFAKYIPWGKKQIQQWATNKLSGRHATRESEEWGQRTMGELKKTAYQGYKSLSGASAATGGRGSSAEAMMKTKGLAAFGSAKAGVLDQQQAMKERIRGEDWNQAMSGIGGLESIMRGDYKDALAKSQLALGGASASMANTGQQADIIGQMGQIQWNDVQSQNAWNAAMYEYYTTGNGSGVMELFGQLVNAGATYAAATA